MRNLFLPRKPNDFSAFASVFENMQAAAEEAGDIVADFAFIIRDLPPRNWRHKKKLWRMTEKKYEKENANV